MGDFQGGMRWYRGFRTVGNPVLVAQQISEYVMNHNLSRQIPVLRLEKHIGKVKGVKEFYFFLGIESPDKGVLFPDERLENLLDRYHHVGDFDLPEIQTMVTGEIQAEYFGSRVAVLQTEVMAPQNPFEETEFEGETLASQWELNALFGWMVALGQGTWTQFCQACQVFGLPAARSLRNLKLLGHVDTDPAGQFWKVMPPALLRLQGASQAFWCGQRAHLNHRTEVHPQAHGVSRLLLDPVEADRVLEDVPLKLAQALPTLPECTHWLSEIQGLRPDRYQFRRHQLEGLSRKEVFSGEGGFYELYESGQLQPRYQLYFSAQTQKFYRGEWYLMRFLGMQGSHQKVRYQKAERKVAILRSERWPEVFERALVLSSGLLPQQGDTHMIYSHVDEQVLLTLCSRLGLEVEHA